MNEVELIQDDDSPETVMLKVYLRHTMQPEQFLECLKSYGRIKAWEVLDGYNP